MKKNNTLEDRFFEKIEFFDNADQCWLWSAGLTSVGYGQFKGGHTSLAHRWSWVFFRGEIPEGLQLDHLCGVRRCVNPWHLDPVTIAENLRRSSATLATRNRKKTHCPKGHPLSGENLRRYKNERYCRTCIRQTANARNLKRAQNA